VLEMTNFLSFNPANSAHLRELRQGLHICLDPVIDGDCGTRGVGFNVIENHLPIGKCKERPFQVHGLASLFQQRGGTPFGEVRLYPFMWDCGARIVESLLDLGPEPCVVFGGVLS
jgi:hypothetical protein